MYSRSFSPTRPTQYYIPLLPGPASPTLPPLPYLDTVRARSPPATLEWERRVRAAPLRRSGCHVSVDGNKPYIARGSVTTRVSCVRAYVRSYTHTCTLRDAQFGGRLHSRPSQQDAARRCSGIGFLCEFLNENYPRSAGIYRERDERRGERASNNAAATAELFAAEQRRLFPLAQNRNWRMRKRGRRRDLHSRKLLRDRTALSRFPRERILAVASFLRAFFPVEIPLESATVIRL